MTSNNFDWDKTKQLSIIQLLLAFALPSAFAFVGFRLVLPMLVKSGTPVLIAWPSIASVMLSGFVIVAFILLRSEARQLNIPLTSRMCLKRLSFKQWLIYIVILFVGFAFAMIAVQLVEPFMKATGLTIPDYMPFFLNPLINPAEVDQSVLSPGLPLKGQFVLIPLMAITLLLNIMAEEFYFRAWILPKLSRYGSIGWVINAVLFALYHSFQLWLLPTILVGSLIFAFVIYKSKSIWPALVGHLVGNFLFTILGVLILILG